MLHEGKALAVHVFMSLFLSPGGTLKSPTEATPRRRFLFFAKEKPQGKSHGVVVCLLFFFYLNLQLGARETKASVDEGDNRTLTIRVLNNVRIGVATWPTLLIFKHPRTFAGAVAPIDNLRGVAVTLRHLHSEL